MPVQAALDARWRSAQLHLRAGNATAAIADCEAIVAMDPRQPAVWLTLANLAQGSGRFRVVVEHARMAAAAVHESRDWMPLADIAMLLHGMGESRLAARAIIEADWADPLLLDAAGRLAQCLGLADFHDDALRLLDRALAAGAPTPMLTYMRAMTLRHLGRSGEATAEYERCLALAPDYAAAMLMRTTHDRRTDTEAQIQRVRRALARNAQDPTNAAMLHYALFALLDGAADAEGAWQALMQGAAIKRRSLSWQPARDEARDAAIMALCRAPFLAAAPVVSAEQVPIFVVGQPRTGTTVLERILGNHSEVASGGELDDFHLQLCWQADILVGEFAHPALLQACPTLDFAAIGRGYLQRTSWRARGKRYLIDKLPNNLFYAGLIHKALPQARIVCLLRDPLDTCLSNLKELFAGDAYPYSYDPLEAAAHHLRVRRLLQHWDEVMPGVVLTVRYEDMVRDPLPVARAVMEHCGLPFEPDCVDLLRNAAPSATASSSQVRQPLHTRGIGAWRRYAEGLAGARALLEAHLPADAFAE